MSVEKQVLLIDIEKLKPSKYNVRIDLGDLNPLVESIRKHGVLESLIVRERDGYYEVITGRRRYEASKIAGLKQLPCIIADVSDEEAVVISTVENIQRNSLTKKEIAYAFKKAKEINSKLTYQEFADKISMSRTYLHDLIVAYDVFEILEKRDVVKSFKTNPSEEEREEGIVPVSYLKDLGYTVKAAEDKIPSEKKKEKIVELAEFTKNMPPEHTKAVFKKFREEPEKDIGEIVADVLSKVEYKEYKEHEEKGGNTKPGRMSVDDVEHSIFDYIHYLIDLLEKNRRGKLNYVEKIVFTPDKLTIHFSGYNEYIPSDIRLSMRHEMTGSGEDMVVVTLREDQRNILDILEGELDKEEKVYRLIPEEKEEVKEIKEHKPIFRPKSVKKVYWEIADEYKDRNRMMDIFYRMDDKDYKALWGALVNAPFYMLSEDEIINILRHRGYSKENAHNHMLEIREEWLSEGYIRISEA